MNQKILTDSKLSIKGKNSMSGYEYLILTVLNKYMPKTGRAQFTIKDFTILPFDVQHDAAEPLRIFNSI